MSPSTKARKKTGGPVETAAAPAPATTVPAAHDPSAPSMTAPTPSVRQRRRPTLIVLGVTLAALGGLGGAFMANQAGTPHTVLVAASQLTPGRVVTDADLKAVQVGAVTGAETVPADARTTLVGKTVTSVVLPGTILNRAAFVARLTPGPGSSIIGVALKPGQMPATGLQPGDTVHVVVAAATNAAQDGVAVTKPGTSWTGVVTSVGDMGRDGLRTVDVALPSDQALQAATASGTGALTLVMDSATKGR